MLTKTKPMATAARPKPRSKTTADVFEGQELGLWLEAEKWLKKHHKVHHREIDLYLSLLRDKERTISWKEWLRRVEDRYSDYRAAEWIAAGEKEPFLLWKRIADVSVGIRFESVGIELHETRKNDPVFRANVSDTGFRSLSFRGPAVKLEDVIVERMGEYREEQAKEACRRRNRRVRPTPVFPTNRPKRTEDLDREINEFVEARTGIKNAIDRKRDGPPGGALVVSARAGDLETPLDAAERRQLATLENAGETVRKLTTEERRELHHHEKAIDRGARAWVEMANGLVEICDKRLWREAAKTFDAWLDGKRIDRSTAYAIMKALRIRRQLQTLKAVPAIELDRESQYRPFPSDAGTSDLAAIVRRIARKVDPDADGVRRPTAAVIRQAVHEETTSPDDLKREAERKKDLAPRSPLPAPRLEEPAADMPLEAYADRSRDFGAFAGDPSEFGRGLIIGAKPAGNLAAIGDSQFWAKVLNGPEPSDGSDPGYWNGQPIDGATQLRGLALVVRQLWHVRLGQGNAEFRDQLAGLLHSLANEIQAGALPGLTKPARRAK